MPPPLAGFLAYHHVENGVFVDYLCTSKVHRRKGNARRLLRSLGATRVTLITLTLSRQHAFYIKVGFVPTRESPYEASVGETCLVADQEEEWKENGGGDSSVEGGLSSHQVPWHEVSSLLREVGLGRKGVRRLVRPDDPEMRYRLVRAPV